MIAIRKISWGFLIAAFVLALSIFCAQASANSVYVTGAPPSGTSCASGVTLCSIYVENTSGGFNLILTVPTANFESLAIGPDNAETDPAGNAAHPFLLYACDTAGKTIIRFDPTAATIATQSVTPTLTITPICGRSSATGDFYVTDKFGPGVYLIAHNSVPLANVPYDGQTAIGASATQFDPVTGMKGRGITQKYIGDALAVDNANNQVVRSAYATPLFSTPLSPFITTNLNGPIGIANAPSLRQEFVSNSNSVKNLPTQPAVTVFDSAGALATTPCPGLNLPNNSKQLPDYLATAPTANSTNTVINDTIYLVTNSNNAGTLWTWNTAQGNCNLLSAATSKGPLSGVAVAPAPITLTLLLTGTAANPAPTPFFFNSNLFQLTAGNCTNPSTATVTAFPLIPATVSQMITLANPLNPQTPGVNLGDGGFVTAYLANNPNCGSILADGGVRLDISNFIGSSQFTNPRALDCSNTEHATEPKLIGGSTGCVVLNTVGVYPLGGPIPGDGTIGLGGGTGTLGNFFAVVNENAGANTVEPGAFCGFQSPLLNPGDPGYPKSFSASQVTTVNVKFKLADLNNGGDCKNGPFITDAIALLSVAELTPAFKAINVLPTASSIDVTPLFNKGNQQYSFTLNLPNVFAQGGAGTYSLTVTFLSDNTTNKTILFILTP
jgi:hypothetical protein